MDSSGHTDVSDVRASASGSNDVFEDDLGLPAKPDALGKNFAHLSRDEGRDLNLESFVVLSKIAEGAFGKVVLARKKRTDSLHAIKAVRKDKILACGSTAIRHILDENKILQQLKHPFILTLQHAFQDEFRLYLVTNYVGGGTLYQLITARGTLAEEVGRFYAAQLVAAFAYLHSYGVVYRDLKPENVLLGLDGYVVLADFGLAKTLRLEDEKRPPKQLAASFRQTFRHSIVKTETFCGTPLYLAPEVVAKTPYGRSVDWWTLGCLTVEMLTGRPPFIARDMPELMEKISKGADLSHLRLSDEARVFCLGLLHRDVDKRLGCGENGSQALRGHAFLATIDWPKLESKRSEPPFKPDAAVQAMGPGSYGRQASKEDLKAFDEFAAYSRVDPRAKAELVGKLCEAATRGDCAELRELIAEGAEVTTGGVDLCRNQNFTARLSTSTPSTRLCSMAWRCQSLAARLSQHDSLVDFHTDYDNRTALHLAAAEGHLDAVEFLVCHGAEVNKNDRWGGTPIRDAEAGGHRSVVEYLERNGAIRRPSRVEDESAPSPDDLVDMTGKLCDAARNGDVVKLRELLDAGADVCRGDYDCRTALHLGAAEGHLAAVKYLVARGADVNAVDRWRGTPLRDAEAGEHTDTVAFLKRVGAVNRRSASSLMDTPDSLSQESRSRSSASLSSPSSRPIRRSLSFSSIRSPKIAPAPQSGGLVINPPARGSRDRDPMNASMDRSNGSCAVS